MSITPSLLEQAIAELKLERAQIDRAIDGLSALIQLYGVRVDTLVNSTVEVLSTVAAPTPPAETVRRAGKRPSSTPPHPKKRRATDGAEKRCKGCNKSVAEGVTFTKHAAFADKLDNHCRQCRKDQRDQRNGKPAKPNVLSTRHKPVPKPVLDDDDPDFDPDEDLPNPFSRVPTAKPAPPPSTIKVECETCGEKFNDAKSMGIHKTRVHFGR